MHRCEVLAEPVGGLIDPLSELVGRLSIRARLPQIEVAVADNVTELVFRVLDPPSDEDRAALSAFSVAHDVQISLQTGGPGTVAALQEDVTSQKLRYSLPEFDVEIEFQPTDFVQVNGAVNRLMVSAAIDHLDVSKEHRVLDLYCGIGNFSLALARKAATVLAIEGEQMQVERGRRNAEQNGIDNCEFRQADLAAIEGNESWLAQDWDRVLLDPARSGAQEIVANMSTIGAKRVVYISCHAGTLARDAGVLVKKHGYSLEAAGIIDMFPHTGHVESIAVFQKVA
jgi:23S rRNA (uracil1939-C5)-methyltransferase